jgi:putative ABC transport system substrate-binding protein
LRERWTIPAKLRQEAAGSVTATQTNLAFLRNVSKTREVKPEPGHIYKIGLAYFAPEPGADQCIKGVFDGLRELGFVEGRNLEVRRSHAQGEIANIPLMLQALDSSDADVILPMSTPVISAACGIVKHKPVVFTYCSDPLAAGTGKSFSNHLDFVTGIGSFPPVQDMVEVIRKTLPDAKSFGTIYNASEANSVKVITVARDLFTRAGIKLEEVTVASSSEVLQAAQALVGRGVDGFYIQGDNTVIQGFDAVVKAARDGKRPLFVDDPDAAKRGAVACVGLGYYRPGYEAARSLSRVLLGEKPGAIAMENVSEKAVWIDLAQAAKLGIKFPEELLKQMTSDASKASDNGTKQPAAQ